MNKEELTTLVDMAKKGDFFIFYETDEAINSRLDSQVSLESKVTPKDFRV